MSQGIRDIFPLQGVTDKVFDDYAPFDYPLFES